MQEKNKFNGTWQDEAALTYLINRGTIPDEAYNYDGSEYHLHGEEDRCFVGTTTYVDLCADEAGNIGCAGWGPMPGHEN